MNNSLGGLLRRSERSPSPSGFGVRHSDDYRGGRTQENRSHLVNGSASNGSVDVNHAYEKAPAAPQQPDAKFAARSGAEPREQWQTASASPRAATGGDAYMAAMGGDWWKAWNNMEATRGVLSATYRSIRSE